MKNSVFLVIEELMMKLRKVAKVGEMVSIEVCCDVIDLMYENDEISRMFVESPVYLMATVYAMKVPKHRCEFPVVGWVNFESGCREEDVMWDVKLILQHVNDEQRRLNDNPFYKSQEAIGICKNSKPLKASKFILEVHCVSLYCFIDLTGSDCR
ncbi:cyclin-J18-like [Chenopodium quinoa]|uniref:cyclin-J18-like n=1 Tax=Chenopodium quinoa TaxID=63459 RepID=UPI000B76E1DF|nr:cyclin-J18-like [Chenopodium quinoa]